MKNFFIRFCLLLLFLFVFSGCGAGFDFPDDFNWAESLKTEVNQPEFGEALEGLQTSVAETVSSKIGIEFPASTETQQPDETNPTVVPTYTQEILTEVHMLTEETSTLALTETPLGTDSTPDERTTATSDPFSSPTVTTAFSPTPTQTPMSGSASQLPSKTNTPVPAQKTATAAFVFISPTNTPVGPSNTSTSQPSTDTSQPPIATTVPPTDTQTPIPPTNIPPTATSVPPTNTSAPSVCAPSGNASLESQIINLINAERAKAGLPALQQQGQLMAAARGHSEDMACNNFFLHTSPTTSSSFDRMSTAGYSYSWAGENIAAGYPDAQSVVQGWMNSQGHRDNILNPNFTQIGLGYAYLGGSAYGAYYTAVFGAP